MRKLYLDNIRWMTVILVVIYHVIYMFNGVETYGVIDPFRQIQYQDTFQYVVYAWFMLLLFTISGMCSRYYLENHTDMEFIKSRTGIGLHKIFNVLVSIFPISLCVTG